MGRLKGPRGGVDCGQILAAVYEATGQIPHVQTQPYSMQHALHSNDEWYIRYLEQFATEISEREAKAGDIVIYRIGRCYSHAGILAEAWPGKIVHAVNGAGVILSHGTQEGYLKRHLHRRFFTRWPQGKKESRTCRLHPGSTPDRFDRNPQPIPEFL
jgi:cell wall-associated NlpC family hydrolase